MKVINLELDNDLIRTGTEPNMGKREGNTGRRQNLSPVGCDSYAEETSVLFWCPRFFSIQRTQMM